MACNTLSVFFFVFLFFGLQICCSPSILPCASREVTFLRKEDVRELIQILATIAEQVDAVLGCHLPLHHRLGLHSANRRIGTQHMLSKEKKRNYNLGCCLVRWKRLRACAITTEGSTVGMLACFYMPCARATRNLLYLGDVSASVLE